MPALTELVLVLAVVVFAGSMLVGAGSDLHRYEIPNQLSIIIVGAYLPAAWAAGFGLAEIAIGLAVGLACLVVGIGLFALNLFGGGDVKLLAAGAVWAGWVGLADYIFLIAISGGILSLVLVLFRRVRLPARLAGVGWVQAIHLPGNGVPYGIAIAAGAILALPRWPITASLLPI